MEKRLTNEHSSSICSKGDTHAVLLRTMNKKRPGNKRRAKDTEEKDVGNGGDEEEMSKLNYELSSYSDLLLKAVEPARGQKNLLKRLYLDRNEVLDQCSVNELRRVIYEPSFVSVHEGRKLAAHFVPKIGAHKLWLLIKRVVTFNTTNKNQCVNYGEILLLSWKSAVKGGAVGLQQQLERIFMDIVYYALQHLHCNKNFMAMLEPLGKARNKQVDAMIYRTFEPNLWRCLKAANESVRYNACCLFFPFYPFVSDDDIENVEYANVQQGIIIDLLKDDSYGIRAEACRRILFILSMHYDTFPLDFIRQCLTQIIDALSVDSTACVRVAVYDGMRDLLRCASALNACDRALKCLFDNRGINDRCDRVRLAAFQLLNALLGHRFIKLSEVVKMNRILEVFAVEETDTVRKEITKLLLPSYIKASLSPDEVIRRIIVMGLEKEIAALSFHHLIVAENLITVEKAVKHAQLLVLAVYKALRSLEGIDSVDTDETMSICSDLPTSETFVEPKQDDKNEKADIWHSLRMLLNCLVVMWLPLSVILDNKKYARENEHLRRLLTKLFKYAFLRYRNTSIVEAIMHLGKTLDYWEEGRTVIVKELFHSRKLNDEKATMYLEAAVSWDFLTLLEYMSDAFSNLKKELCEESPPKKREKKEKLLDESFGRSLMYLNRILRHPVMKCNLEQNFAVYILKYYGDLTALRQLTLVMIQKNLRQISTFALTFDNMLYGIRLQYILAVMILANNKKNNEKEKLLKNMQDDVKWLKEVVMLEFSMGKTDEQFDMLIRMCETYLTLWMQSLRTYDMPIVFIKELCDAQWIGKIKQSRGAIRLVLPVLNLFKILFIAVAAKNEMKQMPVESLLVSILEYVIMCSKAGFVHFNCKETAETWLSFYHTLSSCGMLTSEVLRKQAKIIVDLILNEFLEIKISKLTQSPLERLSDINEVIDFWVKRVILKHRLLKGFTLVYMKHQIESRTFVENFVQDNGKNIYESLVQFLLILKNPVEKTSSKLIDIERPRNADLYEACREMLCQQLQELNEKCKDNGIFKNVCEASQKL